MSVLVQQELVDQFKRNELNPNELLAMMAYGIVDLCQKQPTRAEEISRVVLAEFPLVELEVALKAFELALDCVTDARFVAYCPSTGLYRGTIAGKLIVAIGDDLAKVGGKITAVKFLHWAEHYAEVQGELLAAHEQQEAMKKEKMEKVKTYLKAMLEKETIQ